MVEVGHRPVLYDGPDGLIAGISVEVGAADVPVVVDAAGWAVAADPGTVLWYEPAGLPAPTLPRALGAHESVRWATTAAWLAERLDATSPGTALDATPVAPVALVDGVEHRGAPVVIEGLVGPAPARPAPAPNPWGRWADLRSAERSHASQNGEDGVLAALFEEIGTTNRRLVEFGCGDAVQCNSAHLLANGWTGLLMDPFAENRNPHVEVQQELVTAENVQALFDHHGVPATFDLLSVDIDGNDLWVWDRITSRARVVVVEYNALVSPHLSRTVAYDPDFRWDSTDHFGASLRALAGLGRTKGYTLVHCERRGVNAFFVADECLPEGHVRRDVTDLYVPADYLGVGAAYPSHPTKAMVEPSF